MSHAEGQFTEARAPFAKMKRLSSEEKKHNVQKTKQQKLKDKAERRALVEARNESREAKRIEKEAATQLKIKTFKQKQGVREVHICSTCDKKFTHTKAYLSHIEDCVTMVSVRCTMNCVHLIDLHDTS